MSQLICPKCGYDLSAHMDWENDFTCPECGSQHSARKLMFVKRRLFRRVSGLWQRICLVAVFLCVPAWLGTMVITAVLGNQSYISLFVFVATGGMILLASSGWWIIKHVQTKQKILGVESDSFWVQHPWMAVGGLSLLVFLFGAISGTCCFFPLIVWMAGEMLGWGMFSGSKKSQLRKDVCADFSWDELNGEIGAQDEELCEDLSCEDAQQLAPQDSCEYQQESLEQADDAADDFYEDDEHLDDDVFLCQQEDSQDAEHGMPGESLACLRCGSDLRDLAQIGNLICPRCRASYVIPSRKQYTEAVLILKRMPWHFVTMSVISLVVAALFLATNYFMPDLRSVVALWLAQLVAMFAVVLCYMLWAIKLMLDLSWAGTCLSALGRKSTAVRSPVTAWLVCFGAVALLGATSVGWPLALLGCACTFYTAMGADPFTRHIPRWPAGLLEGDSFEEGLSEECVEVESQENTSDEHENG